MSKVDDMVDQELEEAALRFHNSPAVHLCKHGRLDLALDLGGRAPWRQFGIVIAALAMTGCAHQDEWTRRDSIMYVVSSAVVVADAVTTSRIQECYPHCYENGPIAKHFLGPNPSDRDTALYFGSIIVSNWLIGRALPEKWRPYWFTWEIGVHGRAVINNCNIDLC